MPTLAQKVAEAQFEGLTESEVVDLLNALDTALPTRRADVPTSDAKEILLSTGEWGAIVLTAENISAPDQVRGACIVLRDTIIETTLIRSSSTSIYNATNTLLAALVGVGILSTGTKNTLMALADRPQSWAEANEIEVTARTVGLARGAI
jgi:hypothetical protein